MTTVPLSIRARLLQPGAPIGDLVNAHMTSRAAEWLLSDEPWRYQWAQMTVQAVNWGDTRTAVACLINDPACAAVLAQEQFPTDDEISRVMEACVYPRLIQSPTGDPGTPITAEELI